MGRLDAAAVGARASVDPRRLGDARRAASHAAGRRPRGRAPGPSAPTRRRRCRWRAVLGCAGDAGPQATRQRRIGRAGGRAARRPRPARPGAAVDPPGARAALRRLRGRRLPRLEMGGPRRTRDPPGERRMVRIARDGAASLAAARPATGAVGDTVRAVVRATSGADSRCTTGDLGVVAGTRSSPARRRWSRRRRRRGQSSVPRPVRGDAVACRGSTGGNAACSATSSTPTSGAAPVAAGALRCQRQRLRAAGPGRPHARRPAARGPRPDRPVRRRFARGPAAAGSGPAAGCPRARHRTAGCGSPGRRGTTGRSAPTSRHSDRPTGGASRLLRAIPAPRARRLRRSDDQRSVGMARAGA